MFIKQHQWYFLKKAVTSSYSRYIHSYKWLSFAFNLSLLTSIFYFLFFWLWRAVLIPLLQGITGITTQPRGKADDMPNETLQMFKEKGGFRASALGQIPLTDPSYVHIAAAQKRGSPSYETLLCKEICRWQLLWWLFLAHLLKELFWEQGRRQWSALTVKLLFRQSATIKIKAAPVYTQWENQGVTDHLLQKLCSFVPNGVLFQRGLLVRGVLKLLYFL